MAPKLLPRNPRNVTNASVLRLIAEFEKTGHSYHSSNATMVQYVIDHCEFYDIPYRVTAIAHGGYYIEKLSATPETQASVGIWCQDTFPEYQGSRGRMVAVLEEVVELAAAEGLSEQDVRSVLDAVIKRTYAQPQEPEGYVGETGDLLMNTLAYAHEKGFSGWSAMEEKMALNRSRPREYYSSKVAQKQAMGIRPKL
jgi:hypothetical protein